MRTNSYRSYSTGASSGHQGKPATRGVTEFLRGHDRLAALLPVIERLAALQRDMSALLPTAFGACQVLHLDNGQLVLAVPNAALAARLKQQLPKLQEGLAKRGWQVSSIRLKVQAGKVSEKTRPAKQLVLPSTAQQAFSDLSRQLDNSKGNQALKAALAALLQRHAR